MHREDQPAEPRQPQAESVQEAPDQERAGDVQRDVDEVIAKRVVAPESAISSQTTLTSIGSKSTARAGSNQIFHRRRGSWMSLFREMSSSSSHSHSPMPRRPVNPEARRGDDQRLKPYRPLLSRAYPSGVNRAPCYLPSPELGLAGGSRLLISSPFATAEGEVDRAHLPRWQTPPSATWWCLVTLISRHQPWRLRKEYAQQDDE